MSVYQGRRTPLLRFAAPPTKAFVIGAAALTASLLLILINRALTTSALAQYSTAKSALNLSSQFSAVLLAFSALFTIFGFVFAIFAPAASRMRVMARRGLCDYRHGNPLHLREGELLPVITCQQQDDGYIITLCSAGLTVDDLGAVAGNINSSLTGRFARYAVTHTDADMGGTWVRFTVEDVTTDRSIVTDSVEKLRPSMPTLLSIQKGTCIDLETSGSMLVAGKTRSGKTTGIIALLLQALLVGPDQYHSRVEIVDPKRAELSQLPHVTTIDDDGEARSILDAMHRFAELITDRQRVLNELSRQSGDAVHWWEADMHVSLLFIDEFVALRSILPKRASKDEPSYSLAVFDGLLKRIVTMGASAGCYVIISIAEASVDEGGLPAMLRSAMSTRVLFRPTLPEARLLWDTEKLKDFASIPREYGPGEAWFSSTDGKHDRITYVHFPVMRFPVYRELGKLLSEYYRES